MINKKRKKLKNYQGFSLMESLIGVFIASTVFVTFLAILPGVIRTESYAQKTLIATGLAQEGIEMIRNLRENNLKVAGSVCEAFEDNSGQGCHFPANNNAGNPEYSEIEIANLGYIGGSAPNSIDNFERKIIISGTGDTRTVISRVEFNSRIVEITNTMTAWGNSE